MITDLLFNFIIPVWLVGIIPSCAIVFIAWLTESYGEPNSAAEYVRVTKAIIRDIPLWFIFMPVYAFKLAIFFRKKYLGWKIKANQEAFQSVSRQLNQLEKSLSASQRLNSEATELRHNYENLLTKYGK